MTRSVAWLVLAVLAASCVPTGAPPAADDPLAGLPLPGLVAQLVLAPLPAPGAGVAPAGYGGVVVRSGAAGAVAEAIRELRAGSPRPLLVAADLDGGVGSRLAGATEVPSLAAVAAWAPAEEARAAGALVAREAREVGIDLGLVRAPPLNGAEALPLPLREPGRLAAGLRAFVEGAAEGGLRLSLRALWTADPAGAPLDWDRARLDAIEIPLVRAAAQAGIAALELGPASLPSLTGGSEPLAASAAAVLGLLRRDLGWTGVVAVDLGPDDPLVREVGSGEAAVRALAAGADLLIGPDRPDSVVAAVVAAVEQGRLTAARVEESARRVLALRPPPPSAADSAAPAAPRLREPEAVDLAGRLALATALVAPAQDTGASRVAATEPDSVLLVTPVGRGDALAAELQRLRPGTRHLALDLTSDSAALVGRLRAAGAGASRLVLADFPATGPHPSLAALAGEAARDAAASPARLHLRFDPHFVQREGAAVPDLLLWGAGSESQAAAARLLLRPEDAGRRAAAGGAAARTLAPVQPASVGMDAAALDRVDAVIRRAIAEGIIPGAALAVGRRGGLVRLRGYGRTVPGDAGTEVSPTETIYDLASLTKVLGTTTAVAVLVDQGRMNLDAPLQRYLPEFRGGDRPRVTVRQLLSHTSGLPAGKWLYGSAATPREALAQVIRHPLQRVPGASMEYSDLGMMLLAEAAERAARMPLDRFLAREVFAPLGMQSTMYLPPVALQERIVPTAVRNERDVVLQGVVHDGNAFRLGGVAGHAGLFSTARDVAVFAQTMLNRGSYGGVQVLSPGVATGFARQQRGAGGRALGWDTPAARSSAGSFFSAASFGHTGFTGTSLWIDPEREMFVVLLTNRTYPESSSAQMLRVRADVHDAVARAVRDRPVRRRPGAR